MKSLFSKAALGSGLLLSASQVFSMSASPALFLAGLTVAFCGGLAAVEHPEENA